MDSFAGKHIMFILMASSPSPKDLCGAVFVCQLRHFHVFAFSLFVVIFHWSAAPLHIQISRLLRVLVYYFFVLHKPTFGQFQVHFSFSEHWWLVYSCGVSSTKLVPHLLFSQGCTLLHPDSPLLKPLPLHLACISPYYYVICKYLIWHGTTPCYCYLYETMIVL